MPTRLTASSSSPRCSPFPCRGGGSGGTTTRTRGLQTVPVPGHGEHGCGRPLGRAAGAVGGGIAAAFFASLERCSCVDVRTKEEDDEHDAEAAAPLVRYRGGNNNPSTAAPRRAPATTGKKGKWRGLGCCENTTTSSSVN